MAEPAGRQLALLWGAVATALIALSPWAQTFASGLWSCPFKEFTGLACPGCGTTRAALALAQLDPWHALTHYPLPSLAWAGFIAGGLVVGWRALRRLPLPGLPRYLPLWARFTIVGAVLANWAYSIATGV
ncbi:MAG: DUF2752 domain-containing protein [Acidobacteriota bacterium]